MPKHYSGLFATVKIQKTINVKYNIKSYSENMKRVAQSKFWEEARLVVRYSTGINMKSLPEN